MRWTPEGIKVPKALECPSVVEAACRAKLFSE
jgi:hypothetical protein